MKYPIILKKNIPYISEFLMGVMSLCCIILALCFFLFMPSLRSSNEMKVVASMINIPESVKWIILSSGIGFLVFWLFYKHIAIYRVGSLRFASDTLTITTQRIIYQILISNISKIELIYPTNLRGDYEERFFVVIYQRNSKVLNFRLKEYTDIDSFVDNLLVYDTLKNNIIELNAKFLSNENI